MYHIAHLFKKWFLYLFIYGGTHIHSICVEVRRQVEEAGSLHHVSLGMELKSPQAHFFFFDRIQVKQNPSELLVCRMEQ